jgi:LemA protein
MNKTLGFGCVVIALLGIFVLGIGGCTAFSTYNKLVTQSEGVDKQWANVENVYQRRLDLIPNLVSTVAGQANFEKSTLTEIAEARASVGRIQLKADKVPDEATLQQWEGAQGRLSGALGRLMAVSENYPTLKANSGFMSLQAELAGSENRISVERGRFNEAAQSFNTSVKQFPTVLFAAAMGFQPKPYFKADAAASQAPKVNFDFGKPSAAKPAETPTPPPSPAVPAPVPAPATPAPVPAPVPTKP